MANTNCPGCGASVPPNGGNCQYCGFSVAGQGFQSPPSHMQQPPLHGQMPPMHGQMPHMGQMPPHMRRPMPPPVPPPPFAPLRPRVSGCLTALLILTFWPGAIIYIVHVNRKADQWDRMYGNGR